MSIQKLEVEGFRSFREMTWEPGSLNVVIGPNACGKSNLLGLMEMLSEAASGRLKEYILKQGGMTSVVWDGRAEDVRVSLQLDPEEAYGLPDIRQIDYSMTLLAHDFVLSMAQLVLVSEEALEVVAHTSSGEGEERRKVLHSDSQKALGFRSEDEEPVDISAHRTSGELILPSLGRSTFDYPAALCVHSAMTSWQVYHHFSTLPDAPVRLAQVARYETKLDSGGQNLTAFLHTLYESDATFREQVNDAMNAAFGGDFEELVFPPAADQRVQMRIRWKGLKQAQSAAVLSDGTLRFLFLIAVLANPKPPALIAIDEPETGLHPCMLPILAEYAVDAASRTQLVFTSHSPEFLNAFSDTVPTTTVMQWNDGQTELRVLEGESLSYWLDKYQLGELYRDRQLEAMG
jgi:predicted ATPase